jgi:hypothetical protein
VLYILYIYTRHVFSNVVEQGNLEKLLIIVVIVVVDFH